MAGRAALQLTVVRANGEAGFVDLPIRAAFNFGYAARDQAGLREHLAETAKLGLPVPGTVPSLYPIPPDRVTTAVTIVVSGDRTYAEVEYALIRDHDGGWLITVASDHTDVDVERQSLPRGKSIAPNVLAPVAWDLGEIRDHVDELELVSDSPGAATSPLQRDSLKALLSPWDLIATLERRTGAAAEPGTVILSGTIGGELPAGATAWEITLDDPILGRRIEHRYSVHSLPDEIAEREPELSGQAS
jgi:Protein of unknown function (DUF2848)